MFIRSASLYPEALSHPENWTCVGSSRPTRKHKQSWPAPAAHSQGLQAVPIVQLLWRCPLGDSHHGVFSSMLSSLALLPTAPAPQTVKQANLWIQLIPASLEQAESSVHISPWLCPLSPSLSSHWTPDFLKLDPLPYEVNSPLPWLV